MSKDVVVNGERAIVGVSGIKCDSCDFKDMSIPYDEYSAWLNKPCPKCGENLLTEEDYRAVQAMVKSAEMMNSMDEETYASILAQVESMSAEEQAALLNSMPEIAKTMLSNGEQKSK